MFHYNTYQWDWTTIAALVAPRPLLFANSDNDPIFPMDGNRRIIEKLRKLYAMYDKGPKKGSDPLDPGGQTPFSDLVDEYVSIGGHAYRPDLKLAIFKFINTHLKNDPKSLVKVAKFEPIDAEKLRVFPTDADIPKDALNAKIDETFVPKGQVKLPEKGKFKEWRNQLKEQLLEKTFRGIAKTAPAKWTFAKGIINEVEPVEHRRVGVFLLLGKDDGILIHDGNQKEPQLEKCEAALAPYSLGFLPWTKKSPPNYVERSHLLLGSTVEADAVRDIVSSIRLLSKESKDKKEPLKLVGRGRLGILAAYAAIFEPSIKEVVIIDPPKSHMQGPTFLNVLRVLDIPEALGLLAPRKLTLIGANDPAFDRTAEIYKLAGAADKLTRK
jgi:hypothetical protein